MSNQDAINDTTQQYRGYKIGPVKDDTIYPNQFGVYEKGRSGFLIRGCFTEEDAKRFIDGMIDEKKV
jgi:hypothetical protein